MGREAASLLATADRRMWKLRLGCVSAIPQACQAGRGAAHSDRPVENEARERSVLASNG